MKKKSRILKALSAIFCLTSIAICSLISQRCQKNDADSETMDKLVFVNPVDFVGQYHNKGLEYVLQNYKHSDYNLKSAQDTTEQICLLLNDFVKTIPPESPLFSNKIDYKELGKTLSQKLIYTHNNKLKSASNQLSKEQRSYVQRLKILLHNKNEVDSLIVFKSVLKLENEIWKSNMTENEKYVILVAASVGKYSWKFWSQNKLSKPNSPRLKGPNNEGDPLTWRN